MEKNTLYSTEPEKRQKNFDGATKPLRFYTDLISFTSNPQTFRTKGFEFVSGRRTFLDFVAPSKLFLSFLGFGTTPIFLECT
jgi:hypothetical protein